MAETKSMGCKTFVLRPLAGLILLLVYFMATPSAQGGEWPRCYPHFFSMNESVHIPLYSEAQGLLRDLWSEDLMGNSYQTPVLLYVSAAYDQNSMKFVIQFDPEFEGVSLPYTLYGIQVLLLESKGQEVGEVLVSYDFTNHCESPGISIFSGQKIILSDIPLIHQKPSGVANQVHKASQKIQILIFGRM